MTERNPEEIFLKPLVIAKDERDISRVGCFVLSLNRLTVLMCEVYRMTWTIINDNQILEMNARLLMVQFQL